MMKDYYQILGVDRLANEREIKRAFRKLAIAYHPDRNPSKDAEAFIKEIIEAYEVLDDPAQRMLYDSPPSTGVSGESGIPVRPHRDPRYRRRPPIPNYKSPKQEMLEMMQANMRYSLFISWCALAFSVFIVCDFFLSPVQQTEVITTYTKHSYRNESNRFTTDKGSEFKISRNAEGKFRSGESITVSYSRWLDVPLLFRNNQNHEIIKIPATIYGNFSFAPIFLLAFSLTGISYRKGIMFRFNLGIVNFLLLLLNILFLFVHHLHLS